MTDPELLEDAAKAAGIELGEWCEELDAFWRGKTGHVIWNPLTDDGDALRLAVKLSLLIAPIPYQPGINAYGAVGVSWPGQRFDLDYERFTNDPYAATRRAIVRAAAEISKSQSDASIGRSMK
jgi:hypothetical protein